MKELLFKASTLFLILFSINTFAQESNTIDLKTWWQKDLEKDSIPGIGLDRAYKELLANRKGQEVIVAVLDTKLDIEHEDLKGQIWVNKGEIPDNGIDDDKNGYIDDVNGWNFLGNAEGEDMAGQLIEPTRIVRKYDKEFLGKSIDEIPLNKMKDFKMYKKAKSYVNTELKELKAFKKESDSIDSLYYKAKDTIKYFTKNEKYTHKTVDSLIIKFPEMKPYFELLSLVLLHGVTDEDIDAQQDYFKTKEKSLDVSSDIRIILGDNPNDITDTGYGNSSVINNELVFQHSTPVSGLIASKRGNKIGLKGVSDNIKIMPIVMVADGDENDKDVALGIRYAVDNGAAIINMSWGKYDSPNVEWVRDAIEYAKKNNVLLVPAAGNDAKNIDIENYFPHDEIKDKEFVDNFIIVAGITHKVDSTLVASFSSYGKRMVDILAPADNIYSLEVKNDYQFSRGTSFASPLVSGIAALLKSYFPEFTAVQLKEIILSSGTKIDLMVQRPGAKKGAPLVPFSSLSKTGSILNTYNAIKMAIEMTE